MLQNKEHAEHSGGDYGARDRLQHREMIKQEMNVWISSQAIKLEFLRASRNIEHRSVNPPPNSVRLPD